MVAGGVTSAYGDGLRMKPRAVLTTMALAAALACAGCQTPQVQAPLVPGSDFAGPSIREPAVPGVPGAFVVTDGGQLPFLRWGPLGSQPHTVIIALHGMNDHKASFRLAGPRWAEAGIETWAYDQRGFGQAPGRGEWAGTAKMVQDLRDVVDLVRKARPNARIAVIGESMGGSVAVAAFSSDNPPRADRVVLLAPGVWGWDSQSLFNRISLAVVARTFGNLTVEPPDFVARNILASDNLLELLRNGADPDSLLATRFSAIYGLVDLMQVASDNLGRTGRPTLLAYGSNDQVVEPGPMLKALKKAATAGELHTAWYDGGWHLLNRDLGAERVYGDVAAWLSVPDNGLSTLALPSGAPAIPVDGRDNR